MVGPSPPFTTCGDHSVESKAALRKELRAARKAHVAALDPRIKALLFMRPPAPLLPLIPEGANIGLYLPTPEEAPALSYARFFHEAGHRIALPWFAGREAPMEFRGWDSPHINDLLEPGPWGVAQPLMDAEPVTPDLLFVPLLGFTDDGHRLGQGGGHYDRWLGAHPGVPAIGLAWDSQRVESLPREAHDHPLRAVVTPTRLYGPWEN
ncbi:5-formyltetrahydrofolate cyclo-ligase [Novosphingobium sp. KCTC 2891]|uniref:5-formyltetrahydrofolate cyclo-ligase n=1 Tax=Novosphingobium sp. KCTC 2891 TaxID=2989730 RepID=UPI002223B362|nr:5-formyltetrahydrofolate cyclo-ligase [Novosphingobium sp. KCTC 2891]MCW1383361.1 5-formyltetrahydrofolate cyclo-ligase [Novosphingobium sp. KCTC 2891]